MENAKELQTLVESVLDKLDESNSEPTLSDRLLAVLDRDKLTSITASLDNLENSPDVDVDILKQVMELFAESLILELLHGELCVYASGRLHSLMSEFSSSDSNSSITLYHSSSVRVVISPLCGFGADQTAKTDMPVIFGSETYVTKIIAGKGQITRWSLDPLTSDTGVTAGRRCTRDELIAYEPQTVFVCRGGVEACTFDRIDSMTVQLIVVSTRQRSPVVTVFDAESDRAISVSAADRNSSRIQMQMSLLRNMGWLQENIDAVAPLTAHPDYFVRWHVMREMLLANTSMSVPHLERMVETEENPEIARLSADTLKSIRGF